MKWWRICTIPLLFAAGLSFWLSVGAADARREDLWRVVHYGCVPDQTRIGLPAPCLGVDLARKFALIQGFFHQDELLLVPTIRSTGIEDPALLSAEAPNYWRLAWGFRQRLAPDSRTIIPSDIVGLAVNSAYARAQDQLHIHIDCLRRPIYQSLHRLAQHIGNSWSTEEITPGKFYEIIKLPQKALERQSPFQILAARAGGTPTSMAKETLVLAGATMADGSPAFYLLHQSYNAADQTGGHGEELLDHRCRLLAGAHN